MSSHVAKHHVTLTRQDLASLVTGAIVVKEDTDAEHHIGFDWGAASTPTKPPAVSTIRTHVYESTPIDKWSRRHIDGSKEHGIKAIHPDIRNQVHGFLSAATNELRLVLRIPFDGGFRSFNLQNQLYSQGRSGDGRQIVTNARAGQSYHNYGLAIDVVPLNSKGVPMWSGVDWTKIGELGKAYGFEWGGDWKNPDRPHFQMRFDFHHTELLALIGQDMVDEDGYVRLSGKAT